MVHVVILRGQEAALAQAENFMRLISTGWIPVAPHVWFIASDHAATVVRDYMLNAPGVEFVVARLNGNWGTHNRADLAQWLTGAAHVF